MNLWDWIAIAPARAIIVVPAGVFGVILAGVFFDRWVLHW